ncbi:MAG TPA: hypothetical protein VF599_00750 [Pyrinomonadaceae bacterium]|jgi:hypothetical protein
MKAVVSTILFGSFLVIIFDTLASLFSLHFQINYGWFGFGSLLIYIYVGFCCAKYGSLLWSAIGGGILGLVDSTIGWYISWIIGPGNPGVEISAPEIFATIIFVTATTIPFGFLGGLFNRWLRRQIS